MGKADPGRYRGRLLDSSLAGNLSRIHGCPDQKRLPPSPQAATRCDAPLACPGVATFALPGSAWMPPPPPRADAARRTLDHITPAFWTDQHAREHRGRPCQVIAKNGTSMQSREHYGRFGAFTSPCIFALPSSSALLKGKVSQRILHALDHACVRDATQLVRLRIRLAASVCTPASARRT